MGALHCFSLKIYGFVAVMLFTWSLYKVFQLECLILLIIKIIISNQISAWSFLSKFFLIKKHVTLFLSLLKKKKELSHMRLFLCSSGISLGRYCQKILTKSKGFGKKIKRRDCHIVGGGVWGAYRRGIKPSSHYALKCFKTKLCDKSWI